MLKNRRNQNVKIHRGACFILNVANKVGASEFDKISFLNINIYGAVTVHIYIIKDDMIYMKYSV
jgi:hypothetical protein